METKFYKVSDWIESDDLSYTQIGEDLYVTGLPEIELITDPISIMEIKLTRMVKDFEDKLNAQINTLETRYGRYNGLKTYGMYRNLITRYGDNGAEFLSNLIAMGWREEALILLWRKYINCQSLQEYQPKCLLVNIRERL